MHDKRRRAQLGGNRFGLVGLQVHGDRPRVCGARPSAGWVAAAGLLRQVDPDRPEREEAGSLHREARHREARLTTRDRTCVR
eukprot:scaffold17044_cov59-Phaeocystis_antarctica.AAC.9